MRNITKYKGHMKRTILGISSLFFFLLMVLTTVSSCEVDHFYEAEVTVKNTAGEVVKDATVTLTVDVDGPDSLPDSKTTDSEGKVDFSFDNVAIVKVSAQKVNASGEGMLVLKEDKKVLLTVTVYDKN